MEEKWEQESREGRLMKGIRNKDVEKGKLKERKRGVRERSSE